MIDDRNVLRLWRAAGLPEYFLGNGGTNHKLVAFASMIAAAEREECVKIVETVDDGGASGLRFYKYQDVEAITDAIRARRSK